MELLQAMAASGHEQVVFVSDPPTGLRAIIAIHSTALGPALGGVRFWTYASEEEALRDALRLAEAMTLKAAAAGLDQGGGKAVVLLDPERPRGEPQLRALGRAIDELGGRYIAAEDVGATPQDMNWIAKETPWVTGVDEAVGGSGDPSPVTALGVLAGMRAAATEVFGSPELRGRRVAVQGCGHVGAHLVALLAAAGAQVVVADVEQAAVARVVAAHGVTSVGRGEIARVECDVFAPCALGNAVQVETVPALRCRIVCGAANNQLADAAAGEALHAHGILYAPDFVVNAGGIINIAGEFSGYDRGRAERQAAAIEQTTAAVFALARDRGVSAAAAGELYARERLEALAPLRRRFVPGSRTAFTEGRPLTGLRGR